MLKGFKPLTAAALCLLGLSAFAQEAAAGQWVFDGRHAYFRSSAYISGWDHTCNVNDAWIPGFPGSCPNDALTGWTANYDASSAVANDQRASCLHDPHQIGSTCYGVAYAKNGYAYAGDLPAACNVGERAVVYFSLMETVEIAYEELDVNMIDSAQEFVCQ